MAAGTPLKQLAVLAGGLGSRLAAQLGGRPKPLADVAERPVLEHQLELAGKYGFRDVQLLIHHGAEAIQSRLGDGGRFDLRIEYHVEREPLGTAGAVLAALPRLAPRFLVLYGDTVLDVDLDRFWSWHESRGGGISLFVHPNDHPQDSDLVEVDADHRVRAIHAHPHDAGHYFANRVNAALYVIDRDVLTPWARDEGKQDFAQNLFPNMLEAGVPFHAYQSREYIKDMGTPDRLAKVEGDLRSGLVERLAWRNACPAVFLDRDGTLNEERGHLSRPEQLELLPGSAPAVRRLNRAGLLAVLLTNQPVVARGECSEEELAGIHARLETLLGLEGAYLDGLYYCPHHPDRGFPGERAELKGPCACRKPGTAMLERAVEDLGIQRETSWMVGDRSVDLQLARNAKVRSVLVRSGAAGQDRAFPARPDYEFYELSEAVDFILDVFPGALAKARAWLRDCEAGKTLLIGGLGRSGKSSWASIFREALACNGLDAVVLPLDAWLLPGNARGPGGVLARFDIPAIESLAAKLASRSEAMEVALPGYDRLTREVFPSGEVQRIGPEDVVIVEGVPALALESLRVTAAACFYVDCPEEVHRRRFWREYRWRGLPEEEVEALYAGRETDEHPLISASAAFADRRIDTTAIEEGNS
ncbi:MAG: HAD-IIIA family hydrolase [Myxococcales bacterium]|nr:HAD-IIIA family hydrolase [Myxococcales bacterium]